jgi:tetratricopeptide (TPR) repeat protein
VALDDKSGAAHRGLGLYYLGQKNLPAAKQELQLALAADPGDQQNQLNVALLDRSLGDFNGSIEHCQGALAINDSLISAHRLLADNLASLGRWDEAADRLRYLLSLDPHDEEARQKLETALRKSKQH